MKYYNNGDVLIMIWDYLERFNVNKEYEDVLGYILKNKLPAGKKILVS